jgi:FtsP/CotA-like multicopper oxidase with cupredoxin domain
MSGRDDAGGGLITWRSTFAAKKWFINVLSQEAGLLDLQCEKWSGSAMTKGVFPLTRRGLLAGLGSAMLSPPAPAMAAPTSRQALTLQAKPGTATLRPGVDAPVWSLVGPTPRPVMRFQRGDEVAVTLENELPVPIVLNWQGVDAGAEPLLARPPLASGGTDKFVVPLRHAGSFACDLRLLGDGQARPLPTWALIVGESEPVLADRDEVLLIGDWRLDSDGSAIAPGREPKDAAAIYTVNAHPAPAPDIAIRGNERLRLRIINGCQRNVIALKIEDHAVLVMAIDGEPAEPFLARDGQLVLAPGTRIDAFIDATRPPGAISSIILHDGREQHPIARLVTSSEAPARDRPLGAAMPLPSNALPAQLELRNASRFELTLGEPAGSQPEWIMAANFTAAVPPAFRARPGRVVVLALTNRALIPTVFHLHGHHFRLLDRLDDGWKPFWLDTLVIDAGQTQRIAFAAEHSGRWLMEAMAAEWAAPRLVRWYSVE